MFIKHRCTHSTQADTEHLRGTHILCEAMGGGEAKKNPCREAIMKTELGNIELAGLTVCSCSLFHISLLFSTCL